ncbi:MAG: Unknown protein [uncultured Sulfurovum sp.]|uniref:Uncharacterized protein n=1 Tax=uncultured Sulfurovum sp. TaxID=269237 RepID=A0A6S6S9N8_9BACT|nr:MAG: Unknown protein [uncultured Sulfurovum sp.]
MTLNPNNFLQKRKAFALMEVLFATIIISLLIAALNYNLKDAKEMHNVKKELEFFDIMEGGIKQSFIQILNAYETVAQDDISTAKSTWSWGGTKMNNTSPLPTYVATNILRFNLDKNSLSTTEKNRLIENIVANFKKICKKNPETVSTQLDLYCPKLIGLNFTLGYSSTLGINIGSNIDPQEAPSVHVKYKRESASGIVTDVAYTDQTFIFSLEEIYSHRKNYSLRKMNTVRSALRAYSNSKMLKELSNTSPNGLNSIDDGFVPWYYTAFGKDTTKVRTHNCTTGCTNMKNSNFWLPTGSKRGEFTLNLINNLLNGDKQYAVDGFNNELFIHPIVNNCTAGSNLRTCSISMPTYPKDDYFTIGNPPYTAALYIQPRELLSNNSPEYSRMIISF